MRCPQCDYDINGTATSVKAKGGKPPYGFLAIDGELTFNDSAEDGHTGIILARIMKWNTFEGTRPIAQELNAQSIPGPSGGAWSHGTVARVIRQGKRLTHLIPLEYAL